MKKSSFLQRQLFVSLLATIVLVLAGFAAFPLYMQSKQREREAPGPTQFFANLLENLDPEAPENALRRLVSTRAFEGPVDLYVLDGELRILAATREDSKGLDRIDRAMLPGEPGESVLLEPPNAKRSFWKSLFGPPGGPRGSVIVRLGTASPRYLVSIQRRDPKRPRPPMLPMHMIFVVVAAMLSAFLSFAVLFYYLRRNTAVIESVMSRIRGGDLKARFPVKKLDEAGQLMSRFNAMADEIEALVDRVRQHEKTRTRILEELGHDLRTPLASLKNCLETLQNKGEALAAETRRDLLDISTKEVAYLAHIVEDLLFLARVEDPRYVSRGQALDLAALLEDEASRIEATHPTKSLRLQSALPPDFRFFGDRHLLTRYVRNALDNALAHARDRVELRVGLADDGKRLEITVEDDGPGLPPELLANFGQQRLARDYEPGPDGRISLGLGGVIMRAIVSAHHGELEVTNRGHDPRNPEGARILARLPVR